MTTPTARTLRMRRAVAPPTLSGLIRSPRPPVDNRRAVIQIGRVGARVAGLIVGVVLAVATPGPVSAAPTLVNSKTCGNTYGGDVISATNRLSCSKARAIVRSWARGYRISGKVNRTAYGYRCRGRNDRYEGLTVRCRRGFKVVRFYANVPR